MPKILPGELVVEGKDDCHVIWALCKKHEVPETFSVEIGNKESEDDDSSGIDELLESIPVRLKRSGLKALGIVVDADQNLAGRWESICNRLKASGYNNLPEKPHHDGTIILAQNMPKVGVWLMPNNEISGMLEDFVALLIPDEDLLAVKAREILEEIEQEGLNGYKTLHHPKALIHTWLAWQKRPGQPMGQAITARVLQFNQPLATKFADWLKLLFQTSQ